MHRTLATALILTLATSAFAQSPRHTRHRRAPQQPEMASAKQSVEMKKMTDTFVGMWKTTTTVQKGAFFPNAGTSTGRSDFRSGPAGNSLVERTRSHGILGPFAGLGVFWWDANAGAYKALWCDSLGANGCDLMGTGQWNGNSLVFTSTMTMGQNQMQFKETYSDISADSFTLTMESAAAGGPMAKMMTVQYQREQPRAAEVPVPATPPAQTEAAPQPQ